MPHSASLSSATAAYDYDHRQPGITRFSFICAVGPFFYIGQLGFIRGRALAELAIRDDLHGPTEEGDALLRVGPPGQIIILNGTPRSGKSSLAAAIQTTFEGVWMNLGVDRFKPMTRERYQPGIGLPWR